MSVFAPFVAKEHSFATKAGKGQKKEQRIKEWYNGDIQIGSTFGR